MNKTVKMRLATVKDIEPIARLHVSSWRQTYRGMTVKDIEPIARLHVSSWRQTYRGMMRDEFLDGDAESNRLRIWKQRLEQSQDNQFVCVAEEGGEVFGFICVYGNEDPQWGSFIDNLHVARTHKGSGIGTSLMNSAANWLSTHYSGFGVYLWVMEANHFAKRFYQGLGATDVGSVLKRDPGGGQAPNCRYIWSSPAKIAASVK
jgi:ribosomal protein S18 acetylase RimI-like enzyme